MPSPEKIVVVGGGLAGAKTVEALHELGFRGTLTLVSGEAHVPYDRPPLSKDYLAGNSGLAEVSVHPQEWYQENGITLLLNTQVTSIDTQEHQARLADGTALSFDKLVLATGSAPRPLPVPGADAAGVHYLRTVEDSDAIRSTFGADKSLAIVGGGWIGLEVAAAARAAGTAVTVIEAAELPLLGALGPELAQVFADLHREHGVDLQVNARLSEIVVEDGHARGVRLADGTVIDADAVVIGVGVTPNVSLAEDAGLAVENGVVVDASLRSSDPDIYAVGDIANHDHPTLGFRVRVEHWANALNQPQVAAAALLGGTDQYTKLPFFYTDQYDLGMEYIGYAPRDRYARVVVRGDLASREFVAFWLTEQNQILAAMNVNIWDVVDQIKPLIVAGRPVDPDRLADPNVAYADL